MALGYLKPLIAGHSHIRIMGFPLATDDGVTRVVDTIDPRFCGLAGQWPRDTNYVEELVKAAPNRIVFLIWTGNQHLAEFLFQPDVPFDFVVSSQADLPVDHHVELLPESILRAVFHDFEKLEDLLPRLKAQSGCRPIVCGTPPPKPDNTFLMDIMSKEAAWVSLARHRGLDPFAIPLSAPMLRLKLWILIQNRLAEIAAFANVEFDPVPEGAQSHDQFLAEEFWGVDATHAWGRFGDLTREHWYRKYLLPG